MKVAKTFLTAYLIGQCFALHGQDDNLLLKAPLGHNGNIRLGNFSRNGEIFATAGRDSKIVIWDVKTGLEKKSLFISGEVEKLDFINGDSILVAKLKQDLILWDIKKQNVIGDIPFEKRAHQFIVTDSGYLISYGHRGLDIYSIVTGQLQYVNRIDLHEQTEDEVGWGFYVGLNCTSDSLFFSDISFSSSGNEKRSYLKVLSFGMNEVLRPKDDIKPQFGIHILTGDSLFNKGEPIILKFSPNCNYIAEVEDSVGILRVWDISKNRRPNIFRVKKGYIKNLAFSENKNKVNAYVSSSTSEDIFTFDALAMKEQPVVKHLPLVTTGSTINVLLMIIDPDLNHVPFDGVCFSADGNTVVLLASGITFVDLPSGIVATKSTGHTPSVYDCFFLDPKGVIVTTRGPSLRKEEVDSALTMIKQVLDFFDMVVKFSKLDSTSKDFRRFARMKEIMLGLDSFSKVQMSKPEVNTVWDFRNGSISNYALTGSHYNLSDTIIKNKYKIIKDYYTNPFAFNDTKKFERSQIKKDLDDTAKMLLPGFLKFVDVINSMVDNSKKPANGSVAKLINLRTKDTFSLITMDSTD